ncbi:hypothetical protein [Acidaminococcus timonensis]|uniref:hypothetical protein n=1 Tax=Acidaminococcus timonensis TaxID=1871002 RepID=UPI00345D2FED
MPVILILDIDDNLTVLFPLGRISRKQDIIQGVSFCLAFIYRILTFDPTGILYILIHERGKDRRFPLQILLFQVFQTAILIFLYYRLQQPRQDDLIRHQTAAGFIHLTLFVPGIQVVCHGCLRFHFVIPFSIEFL